MLQKSEEGRRRASKNIEQHLQFYLSISNRIEKQIQIELWVLGFTWCCHGRRRTKLGPSSSLCLDKEPAHVAAVAMSYPPCMQSLACAASYLILSIGPLSQLDWSSRKDIRFKKFGFSSSHPMILVSTRVAASGSSLLFPSLVSPLLPCRLWLLLTGN